MRKLRTGKRLKSLGRLPRLLLLGAVLAVFAIGAAAAINMRSSQASGSNAAKVQSSQHPIKNTHAAAGLHLAAPQDDNGQIRPLTQEEAQLLAEQIKGMVSKSTEGLEQVRHADGTVTMNLEGRFQNVTLIKRTENGIEQACVDTPEAAAAFFNVNPNVMQEQSSGSPVRQPLKPAKGEMQ